MDKMQNICNLLSLLGGFQEDMPSINFLEMSRMTRINLNDKYPVGKQYWLDCDCREDALPNSYFGKENLIRASEYIREFFRDKSVSVLEVGCGNCWASKIIFDVTNSSKFIATDLFDTPKRFTYDEIEYHTDIPAEKAVQVFGNVTNVLLLVSPPPNNPMDFYAVREWDKLEGKRYIIYCGELGASDGCDGMYIHMMEHPKYKLVLRELISSRLDSFGGPCEKNFSFLRLKINICLFIIMSTTHQGYIFWLNDISVLYKNNNYLRFVPTKDMTRIEQLNAVTRLCIYYIIILLLMGKTNKWLQLPIILLILLVIFYKFFIYDKQGQLEELTRMKEPVKGEIDRNGTVIESGYYDSDNQLFLDKYSTAINKNNHPKYTIDEMKEFENGSCRRPTNDNPFMNYNFNDFISANPPVPCNTDDDKIKDDIKQCYDANLYRDLDDLYDKANSQREFYSAPYRVWPPDQDTLAKWLYKNTGTCKEHQDRCTKFEDLRNYQAWH
jgi:hypothetical protein